MPLPPDTAAVLRTIRGAIANESEEPKVRLFEITKSLCSGENGMSRSELTLFLTRDPLVGHKAYYITEAVIGQWFRKDDPQIPPTAHLETMLDVYFRRNLPTSELDQLKYDVGGLRLQSWFDRKRYAEKLFGSRPQNRIMNRPVFTHDNGQVYSYWVVNGNQAEKDLDPFVSISAGEPDIEHANSWLTPDLRRQLYSRWLSWCPHSFMATRRYDASTGTSPVIAISITMPLTVRGARRILAREVKATTLEEDDIGRRPGEALTILLDTWILCPARSKRESGIDYIKRRIEHEGYGAMMLPLHVGLFWDCIEPMTLIIEPASSGVTGLARMLGLKKHGSDCFSAAVPAKTEASRHHQHALVAAVDELRSYPIMGFRP